MTVTLRDELNILRMERDDAFCRLSGLADDVNNNNNNNNH